MEIAIAILAMLAFPAFIAVSAIHRHVRRGGVWDVSIRLLGYAAIGIILFGVAVAVFENSDRDDCDWVAGAAGLVCE